MRHWLDRGRHACLCHSLRLCGQRPARTRARCRNRPSRRPEWCGVRKTLNLLAHATQPIAPTSLFEDLRSAIWNTTFKSICKAHALSHANRRKQTLTHRKASCGRTTVVRLTEASISGRRVFWGANALNRMVRRLGEGASSHRFGFGTLERRQLAQSRPGTERCWCASICHAESVPAARPTQSRYGRQTYTHPK